MKFHKNIVQGVLDALNLILFEKKYADKVLEKIFKQHPQWGSRDRRFIAESVYDIIRNYRYLSFIANNEKNTRLIFAAYLYNKNLPLPDWSDYTTINTHLFEVKKNETKNEAVSLSYPDWLWQTGLKELGKSTWVKEASILNTQASVVLRVNTLKTTKQSLVKKLNETNVEVSEISLYEDALLLLKRQNIFSNPFFKEGLFEIQDASSQLIAPFLRVEPGHKIIDACAGGGGKTLHLSALTKNKGKIIAMDVEDWKLENLKKRARRAGAFNIDTHIISDNNLKRYENFADRLLLDVPCSGIGVIKRNPDTKWKLQPELIEETKKIQQTILSSYSNMLKPGGFMVYSTCSIFPSENQEQVSRFLINNSSFELQEEKTLLPSEGFDGFYMALLKKK